MPVLGVIPARLGSTRIPQKPLQPLGGAPLVVRVAENLLRLGGIDDVVVASDSEEVLSVVRSAGIRGILTGEHPSGTDRVAAVARRAEFRRYDVVVNVQGDEPFLPAEALAGALGRVGSHGDAIGTSAVPITSDEARDPDRVKVVVTGGGRALYFSRASIPWPRGGTPGGPFWQHLGVYACTREALFTWTASPPTSLEETEGLEQLRALELGLSVGVARLGAPAPPGIDTPADLHRAHTCWHTLHEVPR